MTSTFNTFQRNWLARSELAKDEGVPQKAISATISNDYNRVLSGESPMSSQEAYAGMAAAGVNKVLTGDPSGNGNLMTNIFHDAQGIFTGIFHAPGQALSDVENLGKGLVEAGEGKGLSALGQTLNQISQLLPGVTDVEQLASGNFNYLWQHPLYSALDLSGIGGLAKDAADLATHATARARDLAEQEQIHMQSLGFVSDDATGNHVVVPVPNLSKADIPVTLDNIIMSKHPVMQLAGRAVHQSSLEPFLNKTFGPQGLWGNRIAQIVRPAHEAQQLGQLDYNTILAQISKDVEGMTPDDLRYLNNLVTNPSLGQSPERILADPSISNKVKQAYTAYIKYHDDVNDRLEATGLNEVITRPSTGQVARVSTRSEAARLMANYNTRAARYMAKTQDVIKAGHDFEQVTSPLTKPIYKPVDGAIVPPNTLLNAHDFVATTHQALKQLDPTQVISLGTGQFSKDSVSQAIKRFNVLTSDSGPIANLEQALATNDRGAIRSAITKVKIASNSKFFNHLPQMQDLRRFIDTYQSASKTSLGPYQRAMDKATKAAGTAAEKMQQSNVLIDKHWNRVTADKYENVISQIMANKITELAPTLLSNQEELSSVLDLLEAGELYPTKLQPYLEPRQWRMIRRDAIASYSELEESGAKVFWVPKVSENEHVGGSIRIGIDHLPTVDAAKSRALNGSYSIQNPFLGIQKTYKQLIERQRTDELYQMHIEPRLVAANKVKAQAEDEWASLRKTSPHLAPKSFPEYFAHMYGNWTIFNKSDFLHANSRHIPVTDDVPMMIDQADLSLLHNMQKQVHSPLTHQWDESLKLFRFSVLTISPRFFAHITLGGAFMSLLKTGPSWFKYLREAHDMVTNNIWPRGVSHGTGYTLSKKYSEDIYEPKNFHAVLGGRTSGRLFVESVMRRTGLSKVAATAEAYHEFLETWSDHYRVMSYLYGKNRAERKGVQLTRDQLDDAKKLGLNPSEYEGVLLANKVLADQNARLPLERNLIRFVMPFGGWTKHVLRYVLQFPLDHPLRTNFLSNLSEQSYEADTSGLPQYLFHLLYLGNESPTGNQTVIDFRQWNPLRDVANYMTLGGWMSQLNPAAGGILSAMGINDATGAPELYPQLSYDSFYGGYQVQTPTGSTPLSMLGSYIPQFGVLDHFLKLSSYTRSLAKYDPAAYKQQLYESLNFPWMPQTINIPQIISKQETDRLTEMKNMVTSALQNNDPSFLNNIQGPFPYEGWYFTSGQIRDIISVAQTWSDQTGIQVPASDLLQTPAAPSIPLNMTPPVSLASEASV